MRFEPEEQPCAVYFSSFGKAHGTPPSTLLSTKAERAKPSQARGADVGRVEEA